MIDSRSDSVRTRRASVRGSPRTRDSHISTETAVLPVHSRFGMPGGTEVAACLCCDRTAIGRGALCLTM